LQGYSIDKDTKRLLSVSADIEHTEIVAQNLKDLNSFLANMYMKVMSK
jgi:hypothetical protein